MSEFIIVEKSEFKLLLEKTLERILDSKDKKASKAGEETYTINEVAKRLRMSHGTVKKLVLGGVIKSTKSGRITEQAINDYLEDK
jgi:excisionase family DNA binding protein